ncbi:MAG: hypothetical protein WC827_00185 [Candidatus Paceibacterota bacterium]|jgi:hypothetical protein
MIFDVQTGRIDLAASGEGAFIVRKGKKIKIPSVETKAKLIGDLQKSDGKDWKTMSKFEKEYPKLMEGDTLLSGSKTIIRVASDFNVGKEKPIEGYKNNSSKVVSMAPNSEMIVGGFESWDKTDKSKKRNYGEMIKNIELVKGFFSVSFSNTDDILVTPMADIKFLGFGGFGGVFDVYDNILYSNAGGEKGVEYTNKKTKTTYLAKSSLPQEIIVNGSGIYKKGILSADDLFSTSSGLGLISYFSKVLTNSAPEIDPKKMAESYKKIPDVMSQTLGSIEMLSKMTPEDMERMMKMSEEHGEKIDPEMKKKMREQMKELPEAMKEMQKAGYMDQMQKAMAMSKGMMEGLGDAGIDKLAKASSGAIKQVKETHEQLSKIYIGEEGKSVDLSSFLESPRKYKPLTDAKKVA